MEKKFFLIFSLLLFLIPLFAFSAVPFEDNFESYNVDTDLANQGGWVKDLCNNFDYGQKVWVRSINSNKKARFEYTSDGWGICYYKDGNAVSTGNDIAWSFDLNIPSTTCNLSQRWLMRIQLFSSTNLLFTYFDIFSTGSNGLCKIGNFTFSGNTTYKVVIKIRGTDKYWKYQFFDETGNSLQFESDWASPINQTSDIKRLYFQFVGWGQQTIDNIKEYQLYQWATGDYHFDIAILKPQNYNCASSTEGVLWNLGVNYSNIEFQGAIKNHSDSPYKLMGMCWSFREPNEFGEIYCQNFDSPINPGEQKSFYFQFIFTTNPYWISLNDWYIWGYKGDNTNLIYRFPLFGVGFSCSIYFTNSTTTPPIIEEGATTTFPSAEEWITPENCDLYESITERLLCGIKNLLITIFVPNRDKMIEFYNLKDKVFKTKIPFNFLSELYSFFSDVKNSLSNPEITISLFGKETKFNPDFYNNFPLISDIYKGLKFAFSGIFLFFSLKFLNREAKYFLSRIEL